MSDTNCPTTTGSNLQKMGLHQSVTMTKREMEFPRMGFQKGANCKVGAKHNITSDMCKFNKLGHTLALEATWDRPTLVAKCDRG